MKDIKTIIKKTIRGLIIFVWKFFAPAVMFIDMEITFCRAICGDPIEYSLAGVLLNVIFGLIIASIWYVYLTNKKEG